MARGERKSAAQLQQAVVDAIQGAGGQITHVDLVAQLRNSGNGDAAAMLLGLSQSGVIVPATTIENNRGVVRYSLPSTAASGEGAGA